ncbi:PAAR domain-containing protein [Pseudomonas sp. Pseusp122]|uniref:PAAR domain-containing protein n=1 Tax=unclassified Pseudomonas TaxID=196821 RepID=UPI0039A43622
MDAQAAARLGDEIAHGFGLAAMIGGAVVGALIGAAVIGATVATGGAALAIMAGSIAAGGLSMFQIVKGLSTIFKLPEPTTGVLIRGSFDVYINSRNAMRAGADVSAVCSGLPMNHPMWPFPVLIAEGSATVYINGKPAARLQSKMVCGAHIKSGSEDTFIGGPTLTVAFVLDLEGWVHTGLEALGLLAAGGALVLAAMAGFAALGTALLIGATAWGGMALLGDLGDRLGPGYRDLLQGVGAMALLGGGARLALRSPRGSAPAGARSVPPTTREAANVNAQAALKAKLSGLQKAQQSAATTRTLPDGRVRYYTEEVPARSAGKTRGASFVTEHNPGTGQTRQWMESYDQSGNVIRVHPKSINGQPVSAQHYPPTGAELESWK